MREDETEGVLRRGGGETEKKLEEGGDNGIGMRGDLKGSSEWE